MKTPEILAPAGSFESLQAAVRCGADAVYFGGASFNARRNAENFSGAQISEAVDYCRKRNVRTYITLNTLVSDDEMPGLCREIETFCLAGADAFIIQDIGVAETVRKICPGMPMHASTQMSVQSIYGIEILEKLGFSRVVLPRELSEKEIRSISANTDMQLEYFVHGALCMCLSGQCLMSSVLGGRSGNRGMCAQPCRLPFGINSKGGYNLSLKDLSLIDKIGLLADCGIDSLKIEGRMKRPEYVAAAVTACRNAVSQTGDAAVDRALESVFSRSGFTDGYFTGCTGKKMFGIRTKEDVDKTAESLKYLSHLYESEKPLVPVNMKFTVKRDDTPVLEAETGEHRVTIKSETGAEPAKDRELTWQEASARLSKCGGTQFFASSVECEIDSGLFISASAINSLRREALNKLEESMSAGKERKLSEYKFEKEPHIVTEKRRKLYLRFLDSNGIPESIPEADRIIVPLDTPPETVRRLSRECETAAEIPVNVFSNAQLYTEKLNLLKNCGISLAVADNLDGIGIAEKAGIPFATGFGMNIFNTAALDFMKKEGAVDCLLSCECSLKTIAGLGSSAERGVLVYGRIPLMITRNCPVRNKLSCAECSCESSLVDRMGISFPVRCSFGCSQVLNSRPVCMTDKLDDIQGTDFDLLYFTTEKPEECLRITEDYRNRRLTGTEYTRGLYMRPVL